MKEFFRRTAKNFTPAERADDSNVPDNLWVKCPSCRELIYQKELNDAFKVCPKCGYHMRLSAREWINILDDGSFEEFDTDLIPGDPLEFVSPKESYAEKVLETQKRTGLRDSVISGRGSIEGQPVVLAICDFGFMGGSMGSVYGEKMARAAERAAELRVPLLTVNTSGGARMQEGVISLMQMAKITLALTRLAAVRQPHISLLVDPCYGGVLASYASVADIIIAEPGANIGFAGRRVIDQTIKGKLPSKHQTAEFLLEHGMIDIVSPRSELRGLLSKIARLYSSEPQTLRPEDLSLLDLAPKTDTSEEADQKPLTAWDRVQLARHQQRPHTLDFVRTLCKDFVELHGDRRFGDDPAIVSGVANFAGRTVMVIGHQKGSNTRENVQRHFGMARPEGYRKALRMFKHAEKFGFPVLCLIDTPGADPERESEERGQANAIAECILTMSDLRTPIISVVIGEGNSGGAIAIGVADRVLMLENAIYMVVSPEGCASILWRDSSKAPDAAEAMRITAQDVYRMGIADEIIPEPAGGAHNDVPGAVAIAGGVIVRHLSEILDQDIETLLKQRYAKYRVVGVFHEAQMQSLNGHETI
jgi:acetyl-CoA carboxylase carboxyl transferase alpha subunit/acetyl-CoA carboxylase carboxyl transferase beta subunit